MAKALKPLIVVLLVLSIVSLTLGFLLFSKREILKARTNKAEQGFASIAQKINYSGLSADSLKNLDTMQGEIDKLATAADVQRENLEATTKDRDTARQERNAARDEAAANLAQAEKVRKELGEAEAKIAQQQKDVDAANERVTTCENDKSALDGQITDLNAQIATMQDEMSDLKDEKSTVEQALKDCEAQAGGLAGGAIIPKGTAGRVLLVNPDWNFVVLDIGSDKGLVANAEMLVHRNDTLVGKVLISSVSKRRAVADIVGDWTQAPLQEGDFVVY